MLTELTAIITRDLRALRREIEAYPDDASLWKTPAGIANSGGNLALHLVGNLRHFIGARLGNDGFVRDRPAEFATRGLTRAEVVARIDEAIAAVAAALPSLPASRLDETFPDTPGGATYGTRDFLLHIASHLGYHIGQVDYHRRMLTGDGTAVGAMALTELATARKL